MEIQLSKVLYILKVNLKIMVWSYRKKIGMVVLSYFLSHDHMSV